MKIVGIIVGAIVILGVVAFFVTSTQKTQTKPIPSSTPETKTYTLAVVAKHNTETDCWLIVNGNVYDVTSFVPKHPNQKIIQGCGKDATSLFEGVEKHQEKAVGMIGQFQIGTLQK